MNTSRLEVRLEKELKERFEEVVQRQGRTMSEVLRDLIDTYLALSEYADPVRLLKEALKSPSESKFLLQLETWRKSTDLYDDYCEFKVVFGEVEDVVIAEELYTTTAISKHVLIPKNVPTVILYKCHDDSIEPVYEKEELYIFTGRGWHKVDIK